MTAPAQAQADNRRKGRFGRRLLVVLGAVVAAVAVYLVATLAFGQDLASPAMNNQASEEVDLLAVVLVSLSTGLWSWLVLAILERIFRAGRVVWTVLAVISFLSSLAGPFTGTGINTTNRIWLAAMHVVVALILIPLLPDGGRPRTRPTS